MIIKSLVTAATLTLALTGHAFAQDTAPGAPAGSKPGFRHQSQIWLKLPPNLCTSLCTACITTPLSIRSITLWQRRWLLQPMLLNRANASLVPSLYRWRAAMSSTQTHKTAAKNYGALLNASSELEQLRQENELLKIQIEQLKRQIEQMEEKSNKKPNDQIDTLRKS